MNIVILVGRLVKDPDLKRTPNDIAVTQFTLAVNKQPSKDGEKQADFINCVAWRQQATNLCKYMKKGNLIGIEGELQVRNYEDASGTKRYVTEVIVGQVHFLSNKNDNTMQRNETKPYDFEKANIEKRDLDKSDMLSGYNPFSDDMPF